MSLVKLIFCHLSIAALFMKCSQDRLAPEVINTVIFENTPINFGGVFSLDSTVIRLENGRIALKKVKLPWFEKGAEVSLKMTLKSAGDRWDKSGSCFIIKDNGKLSLLNLKEEDFSYPKASVVGDGYGGVKATEDFNPPIELLRFMTPFGVGYYSEDQEDDHRRPVYVPKWEDEVVWNSDVTDLYQLFSDEVYVGVWIDSWTKEGYEVSLEFTVEQRPLPAKKVLSLTNTVSYGKGQRLPDFFAKQPLEIDFELDQPIKNAHLKFTTSGHGGHSGGDEFVQTENQVFLDYNKIFNVTPWRDDCASFRRFNPSSGVWLIGDTATYIDWEAEKYKKKYIEERQASSDLSRSNWCPGSSIDPFEIDIEDLKSGKHKLKIVIPAQLSEENKFNHWFVSAYLVYE